MVAALAAAEHGAEVFLIEKEGRVSGNTALSQAMIPAAGTRFQREAGVLDTPERFAEDIFRKNGYESDPELTHTLCRNSAALVEWLVDVVGVRLSLVTDFKYPGHSTYRMHASPSRKGEELVHDLLAAVKAHPRILLATNAAATGLVADEAGAVIGIVVHTVRDERVRARKVILACNGFGRNQEMVRRYCPEIADALYFGHEGNTGEGILWGIELGAATEHMGAFQAHASVAYPHNVLLTWAVMVNGGIQVNKDGLRFGDESRDYSGYALEVLKQPGGVAYDIFDERIYRAVESFEDFRQCVQAGAIKQADSLEELAERLHINGENLVRTVEAYHRAIEAGVDEFGRTEFGQPLRPPFYGAQVTGALFHTQGGLKINTKAQVLRKDGQPIPNLYAGGGVAVGVSGSGADGYLSGNGLLTALGWGKIAGEEAAKQL
jgi:fumarate reductase flavoprotein subunit